MREQIIDKMSTLITSAFGLVAALAWNDAIKALFAKYYSRGEGLGAHFTYAVLVTVVAVAAAIWLGRIASRVKGLTGNEATQEQPKSSIT